MPYNNFKHGPADYQSWMQLTSGQVATMVEGLDSLPLTAQKFAHLTYQVNSMPIEISGSIALAAVLLKDTDNNEANISPAGELYVSDTTVADAIANLTGAMENLKFSSYSQLVRVDGDYIYRMMAQPSSGAISSGDPVWQVSRIYSDISGNTDIMFADGDPFFDNIASDYKTLSYQL